MLFAGHESFHLREGWMRKGLTAIADDPSFFSREDCIDQLGVGRNMVKAIRYWLRATEVAKSVTEKVDGKARARFELTPLGELFLQHDPYFEDEGTLWILHCHLASNFDAATTWGWFFNRFGVKTFSQDLFLSGLERFVVSMGRRVSPRSLEKDFRCLVRTYVRSTDRAPKSPEETFDCPFATLGMLEHLPRTSTYRLLTPDYETLPELVVAYALVRMRLPVMGDEIAFRDAVYGENSPGKLLCLDPETLHGYLGRLEAGSHPILSFASTAGLNTITLKVRDPLDVLQAYYTSVGVN